MNQVINTEAELDALPEKSVLLDAGGWPVWRDPREGWCASNGTRGISSDLVIADGAPLTVLHDPSATREKVLNVARDAFFAAWSDEYEYENAPADITDALLARFTITDR